jgi:hypothetical protein
VYSAFTPNPARVYAHTLCTRTASTTPHPTPPSPHTVEVKRLSLAERRTHPTLHPEHRPPSPGFFAFSFLHPSFPPSRNSPFPDASSVCSPNALAHPLPRSLDHSLSCFLPPSNAFAHSLRSLAPLPPPHSLPTRSPLAPHSLPTRSPLAPHSPQPLLRRAPPLHARQDHATIHAQAAQDHQGPPRRPHGWLGLRERPPPALLRDASGLPRQGAPPRGAKLPRVLLQREARPRGREHELAEPA